jgi:SAM-dependent methyltransferase
MDRARDVHIMKWFRSSSGAESASSAAGQRLARRSSGMGELWRTLSTQEGLCVLDIGNTSAKNIQLFTEMGHKVYSEDLLIAATERNLIIEDENGHPTVDVKKFLAENLTYEPGTFDCVLLWNLPDYLEEALVKPVVDRLWSVMKPGGMLLAFFHTRDAGPDAPCYRFHITGKDSLEMQPMTQHPEFAKRPGRFVGKFRLQRVFANRHIENLFKDFKSIKFFLARDNIREALVVR